MASLINTYSDNIELPTLDLVVAPGDTFDVPDDLAENIVASGYAGYVGEPPAQLAPPVDPS